MWNVASTEAIVVLGGELAVAVAMVCLEAAWRRGRVSLRVLWIAGLLVSYVFIVGLAGYEAHLTGGSSGHAVLIATCIYLALWVLAEIGWRLMGRSIVREIFLNRRGGS